MRLTKLALSLMGSAALFSVGMQGAQSAVIPGSELLNNYLVIATGAGGNGFFESFSMSNTELGADQEVLSKAGSGHPQRIGSLPGGSVPSLFDVFAGTAGANASAGGNRWNDFDHAGSGANGQIPGQTKGEVDRLPGARPLFEGIDFSGEVALTGRLSTFATSNSDVNAKTGVKCTITTVNCTLLSSNNSYFDDSAPNVNTALTALNGVSQFTATDRTELLVDLVATRNFIVGLVAETTFSASSFVSAGGIPFTIGEGASYADAFVNRNIKDANTTVITDLDAIDIDNDGFAVIDINVGSNAFNVNNTDWILKSVEGTKAIFRLTGNATQFNFSNSSIMLGDGTLNSTDVIDELGAIFFSDAFKGTNEVFSLSNVVLGGVGLWDFIDFNPSRTTRLNNASGPGIGSVHTERPGSLTKLNLSNVQGCTQLIGHEIDLSNTRFNRCDQIAGNVPEPSAWLIMGFGLLGIEMVRRNRREKQRIAA